MFFVVHKKEKILDTTCAYHISCCLSVGSSGVSLEQCLQSFRRPPNSRCYKRNQYLVYRDDVYLQMIACGLIVGRMGQ